MNTNPVNYNNGLVLYDNKPICSAVSGGDWEYTPVDYNLVYHVHPNPSGSYFQDAWTSTIVGWSRFSAGGETSAEGKPSVVYNCFADDFVPTESGTIVKNPRIMGSASHGEDYLFESVTLTDRNLSANYILNNVGMPIGINVLPYLQTSIPSSRQPSARCTYEIDYGYIDSTRIHPSGNVTASQIPNSGVHLSQGCTAIRNLHMTGAGVFASFNYVETGDYYNFKENNYCPQIFENITLKSYPARRLEIYGQGSWGRHTPMFMGGRRGNWSAGLRIKDEEQGYVFKNIQSDYGNLYIDDARISQNGVSAYCPVYVENFSGGIYSWVRTGTDEKVMPQPISGYTFKGDIDFVLMNRYNDSFSAIYGPPPSGFYDCKFIDTPTIRLRSLAEVGKTGLDGNGFNNLSATNWTIQSNDSTNNRLILKNSRSYPFNLSGKAFILDNVHLEQGTEFYITNCSGTVHTRNGATYVGVYKV